MKLSNYGIALASLTSGVCLMFGGMSVADDSTPKLHPIEKACVVYEATGQMMNGEITRCHRDYAYEVYEIQNLQMGFGGFTQTQNQHTITIGDTIYSINLDTMTGTQMVNPMYAGLVSALEDSTPEEMAAAFVAGMGFTPNGQSMTIEGTECDVYSSAQIGTVCMTPDGLMLQQNFMGNVQTATSVSIGDGGDDANYTLYQNVPITQGPDLSNGLEGILDQLGQQ